MCDQTVDRKKSIELADVFCQYGTDYIEQHGVSAAQNKVIKAIAHCRTSALGGHVSCCNHCGVKEISYNSCRYRYCPKCQTTKQLQWLEDRKAELLPVPYFHVVFTLPHELNALASYNPSVLYNLLFKAAWSTVNTLGQDKKRLGGTMGMLAFLHTWGQTLTQHIHLHCIIPGGALCDANGQKEWHETKPGYLFPVAVMSKLFGKIFITLLQKAFANNEFTFKGSIAELSKPKQFAALITQLKEKSWNVYAKEPFNGAEGGLEYLARYVSKTAIGNERILSCDNEKVSFTWRDYSDDNKSKIMMLDAHEFIRRYLSHVLPDGFMRIRSFGFLANACKTKNINLIRSLVNPEETNPYEKKSKADKEPVVELIKRVTGVDIDLCKHCKIGRLEVIQLIPSVKQAVLYEDSS